MKVRKFILIIREGIKIKFIGIFFKKKKRNDNIFYKFIFDFLFVYR